MLPITTSTSDELLYQPFLRSLAAAHTLGMNYDEMAGDRLTVCE